MKYKELEVDLEYLKKFEYQPLNFDYIWRYVKDNYYKDAILFKILGIDF